ncbi:MAG: site-specific integrase [bacterium]|jgi:integrase|nr:site-specific integrase [bacterium]
MKKMNKLERDLYKVCLKHQASCNQIGNALKTVRSALSTELFYQKPKRSRKINSVASDDQIKSFFQTFDGHNWTLFKVLAQLIFDTGIRNDEARNILINEINFKERLILVHGKGTNESGKRDRLVSFSPYIGELLKLFIANNPGNIWLFQNNKNNKRQPYSARRFQQIFKQAREQANVNFKLVPHSGRHSIISEFTNAGIPDPAIMAQSGHESQAGLARYQHLRVNQFQAEFDTVRQNFWQRVL